MTTRTRRVGNCTIQLKRARIPLFDDVPDHINLMVQALFYLGVDNIDDEIVSRSARVLRERDLVYLHCIIERMPGWMAKAIRKIERKYENHQL